jgi:2-polyprenyl-6-hydroxyphenyl methylase/3-demethylubiquinone-9 3-methyltransferase
MSHAPHTPNVDPAELAKFSALAHRWWDPESEFRPLHEINPLRVDWIERACGGLAGKRIVDIGCGGGILTEAMAVRGAQVTGIDLSEKALSVARLHQLESGVAAEYRLIAPEALAAIVTAAAALTAPGGTVAISTLNRNAKSYLFAVVGAEYVLRLLPVGTHDWARFIRPAELAAWARQAGLEMTRIIGMTYNPFTRVYRLDADVGVNYLMAFRKAQV